MVGQRSDRGNLKIVWQYRITDGHIMIKRMMWLR